MQRFFTILKYDFLALVPGSTVPFSLHAMAKLILYAGFILFVFFLFYRLPVRIHEPEQPRQPSIERPI
ncbi:MAG TPA: hypothetical protein PKE49_03980 [Leptospiraceae bacterium]|nr:hypothetical protein [Leptospirales bacterium]HMU82895.1 hypothetical protein [Leptospiraceae bacterium]HMW58117.1 hypothetical protein [Leptospiraceae bacterium]HMX55654.1 hypothetical protein [Leptospiraceae bacterium]HMY44271.1 hypothetical protein [Leptospiraceae bacterium]